MSPKNTVSDVIDAKKMYGFSGIPVTPDGQMGSQLLGLVTQRDIDFVDPAKFSTSLEQVGPSTLVLILRKVFDFQVKRDKNESVMECI